MSGPDIQYFAESGTWYKPEGAVRVDYLICAAGGGGAVGLGHVGADGAPGELHTGTFLAGEIPEKMDVEIGRGGRGAQFGGIKAGDGADGYALIVTHLARDAQGGGPYLAGGICATCGKPVPGGGHCDDCTGLVPGSEYRLDGGAVAASVGHGSEEERDG